MKLCLSKKIKFCTIALITIALFIGWGLKPKTINRAALDIGSGSIKVTVAKVDPKSQKIHSTLYSQECPIPLKRDMLAGGKSELSDKIQTLAITTLANLKEQLSTYQPTEWKGVATAASRQAKNAQALYDKVSETLGMDISIISQTEEGRLGFATAAAVSGVPLEKLIAVDSGSGSFQVTTLIDGQLEIIEGDLGYIPSLEMLMDIRGQKLDLTTLPAPVNLEEAQTLVERMKAKMPPVTDAFAQKIKAPSTSAVGIGTENFIFAMGATGVGKETFTKEELWHAITVHAGKPAEEMTQFASPNTAVLGMVLLYSIMDSMGINNITSCYANGVCEGLLIDTTYWS